MFLKHHFKTVVMVTGTAPCISAKRQSWLLPCHSPPLRCLFNSRPRQPDLVTALGRNKMIRGRPPHDAFRLTKRRDVRSSCTSTLPNGRYTNEIIFSFSDFSLTTPHTHSLSPFIICLAHLLCHIWHCSAPQADDHCPPPNKDIWLHEAAGNYLIIS